MLIGAFIIVACALFVSFVLFLKPSVGDEGQVIYARFSDINNIGIGTRVLYGGRAIGEVTEIKEVPNADQHKPDELGRLYIYELTLRIDSGVKVFNNDEITIQTSGLLGEKSIGIIPKELPPGEIKKRITSKDVVYADSVDPLENALVEISEVAAEMERAFRLAADWIEENSQPLSDAVKHFGNAMEEVDIAMQQMRENDTFTNVGEVVKNLKVTTSNLADSKGTMGRLINEDDLYLRFSALMSKVDTILNDIGQYGLLYHNNKGWQRTRLKRINQLNALDTPMGFKSYFECEVDQINLAMSRLSMLLERAETSPEREAIMESTHFRRDFQQLKAQVDELSDNLRLFNTQLTEAGQ